jgi:hypothetical protein
MERLTDMNIAALEPIATRELRQSARQKRGPIVIGAIGTIVPLIALLVAAAMTSPWNTPAEIGRAIFEGTLTFALFVVVIVGITVAASSVASEREGHTWEAMLLSGLRPAAIVRGKFIAAFAQAAIYVVALAPSAALSFLVGGVTVTEILVALGLALAVAAVAVLFGLAVSSFARTARGALAGALVATLATFPMIYGAFVGLGFIVGDITGDSATHGSTWLAHALVSAPLGGRSFVFFLLDPLLVLLVPGWLILEITKANLSDASDDRSTGLRRWYVMATLLLVGGSIATLLAVPNRRDILTIGLLLLLAVHLGFSTLIFGGEPLGPSRRVLARSGARTLAQRILGPGIGPATVLHAVLGVAALGLVYVVSSTLNWEHIAVVRTSAEYAIAFHLFTAGGSGVLAARWQRSNLVRAATVATVLVLLVIPLVTSSVGRIVMESDGPGWRLLEALSPLYPVAMASRFPENQSIGCAHAATFMYALVGVVLIGWTWARSQQAPVKLG